MRKHRAEHSRDHSRDCGDARAPEHGAAKFIYRKHADEVRERQMMRHPMRRPRKGFEFGGYRLFQKQVERQRGSYEHECVQREARRLQTTGDTIAACRSVHASAPSSRENRRAANRPPIPIIVTINARIIEAAIASCGFCASSHKLYE